MPKVRIEAELSAEHLRAYESEAARQGVSVECLVEQTVNALLEELEREERDGQCPMVPS
jgi:predicted HicB family RNase H-like nuclease